MKALTTLRDDWKKLVLTAWSSRFMAAAIVLSALEVGFSVFSQNPPCNPVWFALASGLTSGAAFYARLVAQKGITPEKSGDKE